MANVSPLSLPAELSIFTAAETRAQWLVWLAGEAEVLSVADLSPLDASQVDVVDGAGVQMLLALQRSLQERGLTLRLSAPSQALRSACIALGADRLLPCGAEHE